MRNLAHAVRLYQHHTLADNSYESKFGFEWKDKVRNSVQMRRFMSINTLIDHIFSSSAKVFKGTKYEANWKVYHDALTMFVSEDSLKYMRSKGYYPHLILQQNGLN